MRVVLIGPRGAGKSTIAGWLAARVGVPAVSTDDLVRGRTGTSIDHLVAERGWEAFREIESAALADLFENGPADFVCDSGGGVVLAEKNREYLARADLVVYLVAPVAVLARRVRANIADRPTLTGQDPVAEIGRVLAERDAIYRASAHLVIDTGAAPEEEIVEKIVDALTGRKA
ncbi:(d)CMP kinase [bacterium]|nr:(d)CMP kinase [bacterium]